jgi:hypothetical protein
MAQDAEAALDAGFDALIAELQSAREYVKGHFLYGSDQERAEAHRHIARTLLFGLERDVIQDASYPYFRVLDPRTKEGMDNSDQRYLLCSLDPKHSYRVFGERGTSRRLDFQILKGHAFDAVEGAGQLVSVLTTEGLVVGDDGNFELFLGGEERSQNWLALAEGPCAIMIRQICSDWDTEVPGAIHIDCLETLGSVKPALSMQEMAERWQTTAKHLASLVRYWPEFGWKRWVETTPANTLLPPADLRAVGGLPGREMAGGHFELAEDEALLITTWPSTARYQGIQLGHHWWESLEYGDRQTSISSDQAHLSSDGRYHFVIAHRDPGVPNWLDTEGFERGMILLRWDGSPTRLPREELPLVEHVRLDEVRSHVPDDEPLPTPADRATAIRSRRAGVQRRFSI